MVNYSKSSASYLRLTLFCAVLAQPFYMLAFGFSSLNVMFTIAVGVVLFDFVRNLVTRFHYLSVLLALFALCFFPVPFFEGGMSGLLMITVFSFLFSRGLWFDWVLAVLLLIVFSVGFVPMWSLLIVFPLWVLASLYRSSQIRLFRLGWFGYAFYPFHLFLIYLVMALGKL